jgi:hypothetical protein
MNARTIAAARSAHSQAQPATAGKTVTVIFLEPDGKTEYARVEFPESIFKRIRLHARKLGITWDKYVKDAITEELSRVENALSTHSRHALAGGAR